MSTIVETKMAHAAAQKDWMLTVAGEYVLEHEQKMYDKAVFDLFGCNALQMGNAASDFLDNSRIPNRYLASDYDIEDNDLQCEDDFLPFSDLSLDLLLLPHRLEFSERPHQTLREAERVMMPEGHLIISGYNPIGFWGVKALFKKIMYRTFVRKHGGYPQKMYPWHGSFIPLARLKDWLSLLDFEVLSVEIGCHIPPFKSQNLHNKFAWLDRLCKKSLGYLGCNRFGGVYFVVAKKRVPGMTPLKPKWNAPSIPKVLMPRPSHSNKNKPQHKANRIKD